MRILALAALVLGCTGPAPLPVDPDAGPPGPTEPAAPRLTPCPSGWREVAEPGGATTCDPWPASGPSDACAIDEAHVPGTPGCARIGPRCPDDGWPADLPTDRAIVYVSASAASGGDGSRDRPLRSIADGVVLASPGGLVAIGVGVYDDGVVLGQGVELRGACLGGTRITRSTPDEADAAIDVVGPATIRDLAIEDPESAGIGVIGPGALVERVAVVGARAAAVTVIDGGDLVMHDVVLRGPRPLSGGGAGRGIDVHDGGRATIERGSIEAVHGDVAAYVYGAGSSLALRDVALRPHADGGGNCAQVDDGAVLVLERVSADRCRGQALTIAGASAELRDVVIRDVGAGGTDLRGIALALLGPATVERVWIGRAIDVGLGVQGEISVRASDVVVRDVASSTETGRGAAIITVGGATLDLERAEVARARGIAVVTNQPSGTIAARDLRIRDTRSQDGDGQLGIGAWAGPGTQLAITRGVIEGSRFAGVGSSAGRVTLDGVRVLGVAEADCAAAGTCEVFGGGFGIVAAYGASVSATDFTVEDAAVCGVVVGADAAIPTALDLLRGVIDRAPVGACVQVPGYDASRLRDDVEYRDVGVALQATSYALPEAL